MKRRIQRVFTGFGLVVALAGLTAVAHAGDFGDVKATVPFDFTVANKKFPAGDYIFSQASSTEGLLVRPANGHLRDGILLLSHQVQKLSPPDEAKVVFHKYNNNYFLSQVWTPDKNLGRELAVSRSERETVKSLARTGHPSTVATLEIQAHGASE